METEADFQCTAASAAVEDKHVQSGGSEESCSECSCEACRNDDSVGDNTRDNLPFTSIKDAAPGDVLTTPLMTQDCPPVYNAVSSEQPAGSITDAIEDLHARQARLKGKKQRHCSFCKLHGFPVNVKGHKPFCQFREKCTCKGCMLIRCNQQVSKSQVRLRRQKDMEMDMGQVASCPPTPLDTHFDMSDPFKKSPMCFKCWVHDSVRVRLKGHRNVCPYARCACPNCVLNADRKRLTRELRQLAGGVKDKRGREELEERHLGAGYGWNCLSSSSSSSPSQLVTGVAASDKTDPASASVLLQGKTTAGPACHYQGNGQGSMGVIPVRMHKAGDWPHLNTLLSSLSPYQGFKQETSHLQGVLSGMPCGPTPTFSHSGLNNQAGLLSAKWHQSDVNMNPSSQYNLMSMNQQEQGGLSFNDNFKCGLNLTGVSTGPAGNNMQASNMYSCYSQHAGCMVGQGTGSAVIQQGNGGSGGCVAYTFCSPCTLAISLRPISTVSSLLSLSSNSCKELW